MSRFFFESAIEKTGRILARQYNIDVVFEGSQAFTDGKKITLPRIAEMTDELKADINGYLDHEVAHCKFTEFGELKSIKTRFHKELFNAVEDIRIEREMVKEFPGTALNLKPLREKWQAIIKEKINEYPWPIKTIFAIADAMNGNEPNITPDIERYFNAVKDDIAALNDCTSSKELRLASEKIAKKIQNEREEEKKEKGEEGESEDGEGEENKEGKKSKSSKKDKKDKDKKSSKDKSEGSEDGDSDGEKDSESEGDESEGDEGEGEDSSDEERSGSSDSGSTDEGDDERAEHDSMLTESKESPDSEYDKHIKDVHDLISEEIKDIVKKEEKPDRRSRYSYKETSVPHLAFSTRFDKVTDHTSKGDADQYGSLKKEVMEFVAPIKRGLERILKVKENAKWVSERERGALDPRSLGRMASNKAYRTVFREHTKTLTNDVAVEILVDMSGSMRGKIKLAKMAVIAMSEALKDLDIPFEVTGFNSVPSRELYNLIRDGKEDVSRFNRVTEVLDLHVFKRFDSLSLTGITELHAHAQNPDGECLVWAANRLANQKQKRKILMVFSDGEPACGEGSMDILASDLKRKVEAIQKAGIEVVGFGIQTDSVRRFYKDNIVINNLSELPIVTMTKLAKLIGGGF